MKKLITLYFALTASVGTMFASTVVHIGDLFYNLNDWDKTAEVTNNRTYSGSIIIIPESVVDNETTYRVTSIGEKAFFGCTGLTSVTIPNSVTSIGEGAFQECTSLTFVEIPNSVTSIGDQSFCGSGLTSITIPNSVTSIGYGAFWGCGGLTSVIIPNSVASLGNYAFYSCLNLTSVTIGNSVTSIGQYTFAQCWDLTSATIGNRVTSIGKCAFEVCNITSVTIPNSVTSIGYGAFWGCDGLTSVTIPNNVKSIGPNAFGECRGLTSVTIGSSVKSIEKGAFAYCYNLTSVTCEAVNPPTLGDDVFYKVNKSIPLYVLTGSVGAYETADQWKDFYPNIFPISAKGTELVTPTVMPEVTSVDIIWPVVIGAASYELVIKDANGNVICRLTFNEKGQLTSIAFNAPARNNELEQTQVAGFAFTVTGLEPGTQYSYSIIAKNASGTTLSTETGTFVTKALEGLDQISQEPSTKSQKQIKDGQVFILRGDKAYTVTGQEL